MAGELNLNKKTIDFLKERGKWPLSKEVYEKLKKEKKTPIHFECIGVEWERQYYLSLREGEVVLTHEDYWCEFCY